ncbi:carbon-nitrogen hydrolase family protein [Pseudoalteromonas sp. SMS1]|uniref:carbon-nitrogen hydrolase family protein n=1 Tax=Pseudoalteromonas sp. SMS1 TaxID=2908894 RepID=UPI001F2E67BC|nr:carbon-nitrogen hydrolase family protein [Pseudoalteromonas sp. SMS1]MCF2857500.1 carbon-nitrogen hydrolase family protein [Pseudoalteromonas sp. SMS1]
MRTNVNVVVIPMCSTRLPEENLEYLTAKLETLSLSESTLVCLPEAWLAFCKDGQESLEVSKTASLWQAKLSLLCQTQKIWLAAGTMPIYAGDGRYHAASCLFNTAGELVTTYNKIHLFDADVADSAKRYRESEFTQSGNEIQVVDSPFGRLGLSVCYDVRFPGLYQQQRDQGADILLVPSAFTTVTGRAHWLPLLQARAIETQCFVIAAAQVGKHENGRETYGHSVIISPWGDVLANSKLSLQPIQQHIDLNEIDKIRAAMPVLTHNRFKSNYL